MKNGSKQLELKQKNNQGITMKMTKLRGSLFVLGTALMFALPAAAQDDDDGPVTQGEDAKYVEATAVKFKPGTRERAMEIIAEYFSPASVKAGVSEPLMVLHMQTGRWDMVVIWGLEGGMADLEWYRSPEDIKWFAALSELAGGEDKASALWDEYVSSVADSTTEVGHYHTGEME